MSASAPSILSPVGQTFAARISERWRASVEAILDVGRYLIEAKSSLPHGEFGQMIETHLPFKPTTAQRLMAICRDQRLTDPENQGRLPASWGTLYELTKLADSEFQMAIDRGVLRADVERWEIDGFRQSQAPESKVASNEAIQWAPRFPSPDVRKWTVAQLRNNAALLQSILRHCANASELDAVGSLISDAQLKRMMGEEK